MNKPTADSPRSSATPFLSVVTPVYNERKVLDELLHRVTAALSTITPRYEILFVNDGSSDGSAEALDRIARHNSHVRVLHLARNFGHQAAVQAGLAHAQGDAIILMDSDLQDSPEAIHRFVSAWRQGRDVVYAVRVDRKEHAAKRFLFAAFHRTLARIATTKIPADAGNFGLVDARVAQEIVRLGERDRYYPGLRSWVGFRQCGIEVERAARYDDKPRVSLRGLFRLAKTAIFSFSTLPLTVFCWIGCTALALFLGLSSFALFCKLFTSLAVPGWTSYVLIASFFGALNALGVTILGEYVIRIYDQVRARPIYVVDRIVEHAAKPETTASSLSYSTEFTLHPSEADILRELDELREMSRALHAAQHAALDPDEDFETGFEAPASRRSTLAEADLDFTPPTNPASFRLPPSDRGFLPPILKQQR